MLRRSSGKFFLADISAFFHDPTGSVSYLVADAPTGKAAIIDPVLDYDPSSGRITASFADQLIASVSQRQLTVEWILETHVHADHLSAAQYLKAQLGGKIGIGEHVRQVQTHWAKIFNIENEFDGESKYFDGLFKDGDLRSIGRLPFEIIHIPGHTQADIGYLIGDAAFVGDALFMPDYGTPRTDFPGGSASALYRSIRRILDLPASTRLFCGHDYRTPERAYNAWESTVAQQRLSNIHIHDGIDEAAFVAMREARDARLSLPNLIFPALQVNIRAGRLPPPEKSGAIFFKIPIDRSGVGGSIG